MLHNINFEVKNGELISVIGKVGAGKSSLFFSLLNEMEEYKGQRGYRGTLAYVEQQPFIFADTFKNNIIFGKEFNSERYNDIIRVCALTEDLEQLSDGH